MKLEFKYTNGVSPFVYSNNVKDKPMELVVEGAKDSQSVLSYVKSLDYLLRGVSNYASGKIEGATLKVEGIGEIVKEGYKVNWGLNVPVSNVVTYLVDIEKITENTYYANALVKANGKVKPVENKSLTSVSKAKLKSNIVNAISTLLQSNLNYNYEFTKGGLVLKNSKTNEVIDIDDIAQDDVYMLVKLINLFMLKSNHLGLVMVNCRGFSDEVLEAIIMVYNVYQKDNGVNLLFFYNLDSNSKVVTERIVLPDLAN